MCYAAAMTHRARRFAVLSALLLAAPTACGGDASPAAAAPSKSVTRHSCTAMVAKKSVEYTGTASGDDAARVEEAAWADVCAKLPEAERDGCRDEKKFAVAKMGGSVNAGAGTTHDTNITSTSLAPTFEGESESEVSKEEACRAALANACTAAGQPGDCLAAGFEKKGEISSSQRSLGK